MKKVQTWGECTHEYVVERDSLLCGYARSAWEVTRPVGMWAEDCAKSLEGVRECSNPVSRGDSRSHSDGNSRSSGGD
jgi:hypothetical protein